MKILFMHNYDERESVNKHKEVLMEKEGEIRSSSASKPVFSVFLPSFPTDLNYIYIPAFESYYFIDDIVVEANGRYQISCVKDVLETVWLELVYREAIIERQENLYNLYQDDDMFKTYCVPVYETYNFPTAFNSNNYVLVAFGGQG